MNTTIHDYLSEIGKKGGQAGKGVKHQVDHAKAKLQASRASRARWDKVKAARDTVVTGATVAIWVYLGYMAAVVLAG